MDKKMLKMIVKERIGRRDLNSVIAEVCEVSMPTAHNWLTGKTKMPIDALPKIQRGFNLTDDELLTIFVR